MASDPSDPVNLHVEQEVAAKSPDALEPVNYSDESEAPVETEATQSLVESTEEQERVDFASETTDAQAAAVITDEQEPVEPILIEDGVESTEEQKPVEFATEATDDQTAAVIVDEQELDEPTVIEDRVESTEEQKPAELATEATEDQAATVSVDEQEPVEPTVIEDEVESTEEQKRTIQLESTAAVNVIESIVEQASVEPTATIEDIVESVNEQETTEFGTEASDDQAGEVIIDEQATVEPTVIEDVVESVEEQDAVALATEDAENQATTVNEFFDEKAPVESATVESAEVEVSVDPVVELIAEEPVAEAVEFSKVSEDLTAELVEDSSEKLVAEVAAEPIVEEIVKETSTEPVAKLADEQTSVKYVAEAVGEQVLVAPAAKSSLNTSRHMYVDELRAKHDQVQYKTFLKWANLHLKRAGHDMLDDLDGSFSNGWALARLINALFDVPIPKLVKSPKLRAIKLDNITQVFKMFEAADVKTHFLKTHHLVDEGYRTMRLGMLWILILDYAIKGISVDELTAKDGLLQWCRKKTAGYEKVDPPSLSNFSSDWKSGLAFCALIHRHHPELLSYEDALARNDAAQNLEIAFAVAEEHLGIARLIDVDDILDSPKPDERSIMTYVSQYFHRFAIDDIRQRALDRISTFVSLARQVSERCDAYEARTKALLQWIDEKLVTFASRDFGVTLDETKTVWQDLRLFVLEEKPAKSAEKMDLENEFMEIVSFQNVNNLAAFKPNETLTVGYVQERFEVLAAAQAAYAEAVRVSRAKFIKKTERKQDESRENEFISAFEHFDTDNNGTLNRAEFKAACSSLGVAFNNNEAFDALFERVSVTENRERVVSKKAFKSFLVELYEDRGTPEDIRSAFEQIAGNSQTISKTQLQNSGLNADDLTFLFNHVVTDKNSESLPFEHLISNTFA